MIESLNFTNEELDYSKKLIRRYDGYLDIKSVCWFIPYFSNPFWGGIHTILMFASYLKEHKDIQNCFVIIDDVQKDKITECIYNSFPILREEEIYVLRSEKELSNIKYSDATICTLWTTAYHSLKFNNTKRKFYFIQDFEPLFYPAGSMYGQSDTTYRFGFYGITNTVTLRDIYEKQYDGVAEFFTPCIDRHMFYPDNEKNSKETFTVFFYARPEKPRNGFELGIAALKILKNKMGKKVEIVTAGSNWNPKDFGLEGVVNNLGILNYNDTADLYRRCDVGLVMMFTCHPSYIPLELMASGCLVVTNFNSANSWLFHDRGNCLISYANINSISDTIEEGLKNTEQRKKMINNGLKMIRNYDNWNKEFDKIYSFMCCPNIKWKRNLIRFFNKKIR